MSFGLKSDTIAQIHAVFSQFTQLEAAILYGSRAKGTEKPGSDIDLALKGAGLNLDSVNQIRDRLDDLLFPYTFDLSILSQIDNSELLEHIQRVGKTFYKK
jgi:predicted nucleotidyltransferase